MILAKSVCQTFFGPARFIPDQLKSDTAGPNVRHSSESFGMSGGGRRRRRRLSDSLLCHHNHVPDFLSCQLMGQTSCTKPSDIPDTMWKAFVSCLWLPLKSLYVISCLWIPVNRFISSHFPDMLWKACMSSYVPDFLWKSFYTLPQKKRNFSYSISPGDPGSGSVTQGHEHYQKWFWE